MGETVKDVLPVKEFQLSSLGDNSRVNVVVLNQASGEYVIDQINMTAAQRAEFLDGGNLLSAVLDPQKLIDEDIPADPNGLYLAFDDVRDAALGNYNDGVGNVINAAEGIRMAISNTDAQEVFHQYVEIGDQTLLHRADVAIEYLQARAGDMMLDNLNPGDVSEMRASAEQLTGDLRDAQALVEQVRQVWFGNDLAPHGMERVDPNYAQFSQDEIDVSPRAEMEPAQ